MVLGAKRGAIYDLSKGDVYSLDALGARLITDLENKIPIGDTLRKNPKIKSSEARQYLLRLQKMGLVAHDGSLRKARKRRIAPPTQALRFMWLELTNRCNLRCLHCYSSCDNRKIPKEELPTEHWRSILKEGARLGCRMVQFLGGEPTLIGDDLFKLVSLSRRLGYEFVEVFTNATQLDDEKIDILKHYEVQVAVSLYGHKPEIHDLITGKQGSFVKTFGNLKKMAEKRVPLKVAIIAMKQNQNFIAQTVRFLKRELHVTNLHTDLVRPLGRGCNQDLVPHRLIPAQQRVRPKFPPIDKYTFAQRLYGHSCFFGEICIASDGRIFPCPMERDVVIGNAKTDSLQSVMESETLRRTWGLSKDKIETCMACEYRYACFDCRPKVKGQTGDFYAKPPECFYDPYKGKWVGPVRRCHDA